MRHGYEDEVGGFAACLEAKAGTGELDEGGPAPAMAGAAGDDALAILAANDEGPLLEAGNDGDTGGMLGDLVGDALVGVFMSSWRTSLAAATRWSSFARSVAARALGLRVSAVAMQSAKPNVLIIGISPVAAAWAALAYLSCDAGWLRRIVPAGATGFDVSMQVVTEGDVLLSSRLEAQKQIEAMPMDTRLTDGPLPMTHACVFRAPLLIAVSASAGEGKWGSRLSARAVRWGPPASPGSLVDLGIGVALRP